MRTRLLQSLTPVYRIGLAALLVALLTWVVFSSTLHYDFLRYDDEKYVYENPHISPLNGNNVRWIMTHGYFNSYTPLALLSHAIDFRIWKLDAYGHHLTNNLLHALNAGWVFLLSTMVLGIRKWKTNQPESSQGFSVHLIDTPILLGSVVASLLYALHPLRVESVAWVSDRKDLLAAFFLLPACMAYLRFSVLRGSPPGRTWYMVSLVLFLLSALSKTVVVAAPLVALLADALLLQVPDWRKRFPSLLLEKLPFFGVSLFAGVGAVLSVTTTGTAYVLEHLSTAEMGMVPLYSVSFYLEKLLIPVALAPIYSAPGTLRLLAFALAAVFLTVVCVAWAARGNRLMLLGWLFYVLLLLPTATSITAGTQPWADRYSYIPTIGLFMILGGVVSWVWRMGEERRGWVLRRSALAFCTLLVLVLSWSRTADQLPYWKDSITLWRQAASVSSPPSPLVSVALGVALAHSGRIDEAMRSYDNALAIDPRLVEAHVYRAMALQAARDTANAMAAYQQAIMLDPANLPARINLGVIYAQQGELEKAISEYATVLQKDPQNGQAYYDLGNAYELLRDPDRAIECYRTCMRVYPSFVPAYTNLAQLYVDLGMPGKALEAYSEALEINPRNAQAHYNMGVAYESIQNLTAASSHYKEALLADSTLVDVYVNLGNIYVRNGRIEEGITLYRRAMEINADSVDAPYNLACVYRSQGLNEEARRLLEGVIGRRPSFAAAHRELVELCSVTRNSRSSHRGSHNPALPSAGSPLQVH